jgi:hypothetical protein
VPRTPPRSDGSTPDRGSNPPSFWEVHERVGWVELGPESRVLVSAVMRDGQWFVRLAPMRLSMRASGPQWAVWHQAQLFPPAAIASLRELLLLAVGQVPGFGDEAEARVDGAAAELNADEIAAETATDLPDREALSLIDAHLFAPRVDG